jgi:D-aspartate ligase
MTAADRTFDVSTPAVVLKLDPNVFHHGGLGAIRTLGRLGVCVYAVHEDLLAPAASSRYLSGRWQWNPGPNDAERVRLGLARLGEQIGRQAVLLPTDDAGAIFLAEHGETLRRWFLFPAPDPGLPRRVAGKDSLADLCRDRPLPCPRITRPASYDEALSFVRLVGLPVFAKLAAPWERRPDVPRRSTTLVRTLDDLAKIYPPTAGQPADGILLQENVGGGPGTDWFFHGYCDSESNCLPSFTGIKERSYPPHAGLTTFARAVANERLRAEAMQLLRDLQYRGSVDLDLRWDGRIGQYRLLDFNPRLGAQFRLFQDGNGVDIARAAYLDLTGQRVPEQTSAPDRCFIVENYDVLAAYGYHRMGELNWLTWARSLRSIDEKAWFARDDLVPFGLMCLRFGWRALERRLGSRSKGTSLQPPRYRPGRAARRHHGESAMPRHSPAHSSAGSARSPSTSS